MKKKIISAIALVSAVILTLGCATGCGTMLSPFCERRIPIFHRESCG